ncbi:MAG: hypothetical protein FGM53_06495 [Rhodocyclaceae bacterium]|jgi:Tfp pilus assembly protein PilN|nr:hypothetical protein [Rhodocyclaceae bacterium]
MMDVRFNLLPHRRMSQDLAWRVFARQVTVTASAALVITALGALVMQRSNSDQVSFQQALIEENRRLVPEYEESLRVEQQYQRMVLRQKVIEGLDARRSTSVLILNDLAAALPREVYLLRLSEDGQLFEVEGKSVDAAAIARFLERLANSAYLEQVTLGEIRTQDSDGIAAYQFSITGKVRLANLAKSKSEGAGR